MEDVLAAKEAVPLRPVQRRLGLFLFFLSFVTYLDRINIAIAGEPLIHEFGFTRVQLGTIFSAFVLGYTIFQLPAGWLGDRFGHKKIMILAVVWWSLFTALTAWAGHSFLVPLIGITGAFWLVRFLIGLGEAATYPCAQGLIAQWFTADQRGAVTGFMYAGVGIGTAAASPIIAWLAIHAGWQAIFYLSSVIGLLLAVSQYFGMPGRNRQNHHGDAHEVANHLHRKDHQAVEFWKLLLGNSQLWLLTLGMFMFGYIVYVYYFWFLVYLIDIRGFSLLRSSLASSAPFLMMAIGAPAGGWLSDHLIPRAGRNRARQLVAIGALSFAALFIVLGSAAANQFTAVAFLSLGAGSVYFSVSSYFATALDILPDQPATVAGLINMGANLGGVVSPTLTPWIALRYGWIAALWLTAGMALLAAVLWFFVRPRKHFAVSST